MTSIGPRHSPPHGPPAADHRPGLLDLQVTAPELLMLPTRNKLGASLRAWANGPGLERTRCAGARAGRRLAHTLVVLATGERRGRGSNAMRCPAE